MQTLSEIKALLAERGFTPRKMFGQNFLIDHNLIRKLVDAAAPAPGELVIEIGPGTGTLTEELLSRGVTLIGAEIDRGLSQMLRERFADRGDAFTLVEGDCLAGKHELSTELLAAIGGRPFVLIANLPYAAATPIMLILMARFPACRGLFVTIQKEVADRLNATHGSKDYGPLGVLTNVTCEYELVAKLPPSCFWPQPDVTSAMVALRRRPTPLCEAPGDLTDFCQRLFEQRRKQLGAVLGRDGPWPADIAPTDRAESLSIQQLIALWRLRAV